MDKTILKREEQATFALRELFRRYGYLPYKMRRFEEYDLYVRNKDFLISDQVITFADRNGKLLALKPDVTLSIIKNSADTPGAVQKLYYSENVYRMDKATHAFKEILQTGLECVGDLGSYEIAEVVLLAAKSLEKLGGPFVLDISHVGLIGAVLSDCGLEGERKSKALECLRQKNEHELTAMAEGLPTEQKAKLERLACLSGAPRQVLDALEAVLTTQEERRALEELRTLCAILERGGYADTVRVDFSVGNDMKYYNGVVFKGYLQGMPTGILSGGQYDKLLRKMGRKSRAIGFALYLSLLEGRDAPEKAFEVDTVILHDETADPAQLILAAEDAAEEGSVLVCTSLPQGRSWRRLIKLEQGEARILENNG